MQSVGSFLPWDLANGPGEEEFLERGVAVLSADLAGFRRANERGEPLNRQDGPLQGGLVIGAARVDATSRVRGPWRKQRRS